MRTEQQRQRRKERKRTAYGLPAINAQHEIPSRMAFVSPRGSTVFRRAMDADVADEDKKRRDAIASAIANYKKPKHNHFRSK